MDANPPFQSFAYEIENQWVGVQGDEGTIVYAGAVGTDLSQGILVVRVQPISDPTLSHMTVTEFPTPSKHGAVAISAANGYVLTLTTADGTTFTFDAGTDIDK